MTRYWAEYAWLGGDTPAADVLIEYQAGRFTTVAPGVPAPANAVQLAGLTLPGLANAHSHAFHRALRGRTARGANQGTYWNWREQMYAVADRLDPDSYHELATAVYAEMALAGITCVGEFNYLHHAPGGRRYADPNAMSEALVAAAASAGIRITLLDSCYLTATVDGAPLEGPQLRFGDGDAAAWAARVHDFRVNGRHARLGAAIHSIRAVPAGQLPDIVAASTGRPLHTHVCEQPAEVEASLLHYGRTPVAVFAGAGVLRPGATAVHATHLTEADRAELSASGAAVCLCPTTERDLGDGIGPGRALADSGVPLCLGTDSQVTIDLFQEAAAVEAHERLRTGRRGHFTADELLTAATAAGHAALGWADAGRIAVGARADLVTVALTTPRTAGADPANLIFTATAADVTTVLIDGRPVVREGQHEAMPDLAARLAHCVTAVNPDQRRRAALR
ncbi:MAG TPA: formimidoylglutamate deiminase [Micromonosporaceae bacterium]|nr:formimidoylglutamate deiminase [Micromonosporaceae bacterium]